jgi:hypothetical protein
MYVLKVSALGCKKFKSSRNSVSLERILVLFFLFNIFFGIIIFSQVNSVAMHIAEEGAQFYNIDLRMSAGWITPTSSSCSGRRRSRPTFSSSWSSQSAAPSTRSCTSSSRRFENGRLNANKINQYKTILVHSNA